MKKVVAVVSFGVTVTWILPAESILISSRPADKCSARYQLESDALDVARQPSFQKAFASKKGLRAYVWVKKAVQNADATHTQSFDRIGAATTVALGIFVFSARPTPQLDSVEVTFYSFIAT